MTTPVGSGAATKDGKVNVERFAGDVIDNYAKAKSHAGLADRAGPDTTHKAASNLEQDTNGKIGYTAASRIAKDAISNYETNRSRGMEHREARSMAASDTDQRFSSSGKDLLPQHRAKERGMSL